MPQLKGGFGTTCILAAAITTTSCVAMRQAAAPVANAGAEISGTPISADNKADLVGCWTDMHWVVLPNIDTGNPTEKAQVGSTVCFDGEIFTDVTVWPVDAMGFAGHYKIVSVGALELAVYAKDKYRLSYRMNILFRSRNDLSGEYLLGGNEPPRPFSFHRDPSNKAYLKLKDLYKDWLRDVGAPNHNEAG